MGILGIQGLGFRVMGNVTLRTLNYGNYGLFSIMGFAAGFISSTVGWPEDNSSQCVTISQEATPLNLAPEP